MILADSGERHALTIHENLCKSSFDVPEMDDVGRRGDGMPASMGEAVFTVLDVAFGRVEEEPAGNRTERSRVVQNHKTLTPRFDQRRRIEVVGEKCGIASFPV